MGWVGVPTDYLVAPVLNWTGLRQYSFQHPNLTGLRTSFHLTVVFDAIHCNMKEKIALKLLVLVPPSVTIVGIFVTLTLSVPTRIVCHELNKKVVNNIPPIRCFPRRTWIPIISWILLAKTLALLYNMFNLLHALFIA